MDWLNYHHLLYFWAVAREGGVARASAQLGLAHPTISGQVHALEQALGERLFTRVGRRLVLTEMGRLVYQYADEIFALGRELVDAVHGRPAGRPARLVVGIADVVPKLVVRRLLEPALRLPDPVRLVCREGRPERLLADLSVHALDVVLADSPVGPGSSVHAYSHLLGECGVSFLATPGLARKHRRGFPRSLADAPLLLPTDATTLRRSLDQWLDALGIRPRIAGEFDDGALLKVFGQDGVGVFPVHGAIEGDVRRQHEVELVGRVREVRERFYAITVDRRVRHPAVVAICETARRKLRLFA